MFSLRFATGLTDWLFMSTDGSVPDLKSECTQHMQTCNKPVGKTDFYKRFFQTPSLSAALLFRLGARPRLINDKRAGGLMRSLHRDPFLSLLLTYTQEDTQTQSFRRSPPSVCNQLAHKSVAFFNKTKGDEKRAAIHQFVSSFSAAFDVSISHHHLPSSLLHIRE
jgi:hypothetical protein